MEEFFGASPGLQTVATVDSRRIMYKYEYNMPCNHIRSTLTESLQIFIVLYSFVGESVSFNSKKYRLILLSQFTFTTCTSDYSFYTHHYQWHYSSLWVKSMRDFAIGPYRQRLFFSFLMLNPSANQYLSPFSDCLIAVFFSALIFILHLR